MDREKEGWGALTGRGQRGGGKRLKVLPPVRWGIKVCKTLGGSLKATGMKNIYTKEKGGRGQVWCFYQRVFGGVREVNN